MRVLSIKGSLMMLLFVLSVLKQDFDMQNIARVSLFVKCSYCRLHAQGKHFRFEELDQACIAYNIHTRKLVFPGYLIFQKLLPTAILECIEYRIYYKNIFRSIRITIVSNQIFSEIMKLLYGLKWTIDNIGKFKIRYNNVIVS